MDIYDISISLITRQYLEYLEVMKELNLEIASEFLVMAATLIYIKSRMLLPPDEVAPPEEEEDPRASLVQRLLEYQAFKEAAEQLKAREEIWSNAFSRLSPDDEEMSVEPELHLFEVNLFDLVSAFKKIIAKTPVESLKITRETLTVKDRMVMILEKMENDHTVRFSDLFQEDKTRLQIIVTFLALLEILRLGLVRAYQNKEFDAIWIMRKPQEVE